MGIHKFKGYNPNDEKSFDYIKDLIEGKLYLATESELNDPHEANLNGKRICSFTFGSNSNLMLWVHYANSFNGVAVEFCDVKMDKIVKENPKYFSLERITYVLNKEKSEMDLGPNRKYFQWHYENEIRLTCSENFNEKYFELKPKKVLFGYKFKEAHKDKFDVLVEICKKNKTVRGVANKNMAISQQEPLLKTYLETIKLIPEFNVKK